MKKEINMELVRQFQNREIILKNVDSQEIVDIIKVAFPNNLANGNSKHYYVTESGRWDAKDDINNIIGNFNKNVPIINSSEFFKPVETLLTNIL